MDGVGVIFPSGCNINAELELSAADTERELLLNRHYQQELRIREFQLQLDIERKRDLNKAGYSQGSLDSTRPAVIDSRNKVELNALNHIAELEGMVGKSFQCGKDSVAFSDVVPMPPGPGFGRSSVTHSSELQSRTQDESEPFCLGRSWHAGVW